ncbi:26258_t:CDS:2, partial [Gigaspora rosea]
DSSRKPTRPRKFSYRRKQPPLTVTKKPSPKDNGITSTNDSSRKQHSEITTPINDDPLRSTSFLAPFRLSGEAKTQQNETRSLKKTSNIRNDKHLSNVEPPSDEIYADKTRPVPEPKEKRRTQKVRNKWKQKKKTRKPLLTKSDREN